MLFKISRLVGNYNQIFKLFLLILIGALVELISVGAILTALFMIVETPDNQILINVKNFISEINILNDKSFITIILLFLAATFIIKFFYLMFLSYYQAIFGNKVKINLSKTILKKYLTANYQFHIKNNSAFLIRNIAGEIEVFYKSVFVPFLIVVMELLIATSLVVFLLIYSLESTIIIIITLVLLFYLYLLIFKKVFLKWGRERQYHDGMKLKYLSQSLQFAKLIKFIRKENFFIKKYLDHFYQTTEINKKFTVMLLFPRLFLELFLVLSLITASFFLLNKGIQLYNLFELLSIYVVAAYRLIPSVSRLSQSFQSIATGKPALNKLIEILESKISVDQNREETVKNSFNEKIEIKELSFSYDNNEKIFKNFNLQINKGEFLGIIGDSGSGKSTLVDILLGILKPDEGNIYLDNKKIDNEKALNLKIGYVPQDSFILDDTITNNVAFGVKKELIDFKKLNNALELSKLKNFVDDLPDGLNTQLSEKGSRLSGGQRQRISLARSLYLEPEILILDEATSGVDIDTEHQILSDLKSLKSLNTIILISHRKESMTHCDRIFDLKSKKKSEESIN